MIEITNLEEWTKEYFSDPENQKIPFAKVDGKKGKIKINMLDQSAEFLPE